MSVSVIFYLSLNYCNPNSAVANMLMDNQISGSNTSMETLTLSESANVFYEPGGSCVGSVAQEANLHRSDQRRTVSTINDEIVQSVFSMEATSTSSKPLDPARLSSRSTSARNSGITTFDIHIHDPVIPDGDPGIANDSDRFHPVQIPRHHNSPHCLSPPDYCW